MLAKSPIPEIYVKSCYCSDELVKLQEKEEEAVVEVGGAASDLDSDSLTFVSYMARWLDDVREQQQMGNTKIMELIVQQIKSNIRLIQRLRYQRREKTMPYILDQKKDAALMLMK